MLKSAAGHSDDYLTLINHSEKHNEFVAQNDDCLTLSDFWHAMAAMAVNAATSDMKSHETKVSQSGQPSEQHTTSDKGKNHLI